MRRMVALLTLIAIGSASRAVRAEDDLEAWEKESALVEKRQRKRAKPRNPEMARAGRAAFFVGLSVAGTFGAQIPILLYGIAPSTIEESCEGCEAADEALARGGVAIGFWFFTALAATGGATLITGGVLWQVGASEAPRSALRVTPRGLTLSF
jgi:hypothetical protein